MGLPALSFAPLTHQISFCGNQLCPRSRLQIRARSYSTSVSCSMRLPRMDQFPDYSSYKLHLSNVKGKILEFVPDSIKKFPWKKAENVALQQFLNFGQEAMKWSLLAFLICTFFADTMYFISRNKELIVPFGLLAGCLITEFFQETSEQFFYDSKEKSSTWYLLGMGCFFILVKSISVYLPVGGRVFVSHAANGGLMQVLWHLNSSPVIGRGMEENERT